MGTSTLAVLAAIVAFAVVSLRSLLKNKTNWKTVLKDTLNTGVVSVCIWLCLYLTAVLTTVYRDHTFLVAANRQAQTTIAQLRNENAELHKNPKAASTQLQDSNKAEDTIEPHTRPRKLPTPVPNAPAAQPEPPIMTGIRIASQKRIPSDDPKFPYGLEVVIQTDANIEPVAIAVTCSGRIGKANAGFSNGGAYTMAKQGFAQDRQDVFLAEWKTPAWTPQDSIVARLYSETAINARSVSRFNYTWP